MKDNTFEIGLVMAGAVSAGAYTAGVIDFLLQALNEWEHARKNGEKVPPHHINIKVIAGASAGGMTGAIMTAMLNEDIQHITSLPGREPVDEEIVRNKLYHAWVEQIDISKLLGKNDLRHKKSRVTSLLDSTVLDDIADSTIRFTPGTQRPPYIDEDLHLYLTLTNLAGIPYNIAFKGGSGGSHIITQHTDSFHFVLSDDEPEPGEAVWLNTKNDEHPNWKLLKQIALATGAFPGGLAPRLIKRPFNHYDLRTWNIPQRPNPDDPDAPTECYRTEPIQPNWPSYDGDSFHFLSVDGGVMDNEPLELARMQLAGNKKYNPRSGKDVNRSVLMIDPFPSEKNTVLETENDLKDHDILNVFTRLFGSLLSQSRFKPDELLLANSNQVHSRFLIAPTRYLNDKEKASHPIASGFMNGFGGFISKRFRMHDFQLGRRNCQQFLRRYFTIPANDARQNPVFGKYNDSDFEDYAIMRDGVAHIPLIPLIGAAENEAFPLQWSTLAMSRGEEEVLRDQVYERTKIVIDRMLDHYISGGFTRKAAKLVARFKRKDISNKIVNIITSEMDEFGLRA